MKNLLLIFFGAVLLFSCSKDNIEISEENQKIEDNQVDLRSIISGFNSEYAEFKDQEEYQSFIETFNSLSQSEKDEILKQLPYQTVKESLKKVYEEMNSYTTEQEFYNAVNLSKGLLTISLNSDGEKEVYESGLTKNRVINFLNSDRYIKIDSDYYKFVGKYSVQSENINLLRKIQTEDDVEKSTLIYKETYKSLLSQSVDKLNVRWGDENNELWWSRTNNINWSK